MIYEEFKPFILSACLPSDHQHNSNKLEVLRHQHNFHRLEVGFSRVQTGKIWHNSHV